MIKYRKILDFLDFTLTSVIWVLPLYCILVYLGMNCLASFAMGFIILAFINFFFNERGNYKRGEIIKYLLIYLSVICISLILMNLFVNVFLISKKIAPILALFLIIPSHFLLSKIFDVEYLKTDHYLKHLKTFVANNKILTIVSVIFIITIIPVLVNNLYNNPVADDYTQYNIFMRLLDGRNLNFLTFLQVSFEKTIESYFSWQGTYFSHLILNFNPLLISVSAYKISMLLIQLLYIASIMFFFYCLTKIKNFINVKQSLVFGLVYLIYSIMFMYSPAEGLYWFSGTTVYLIPFSLSFIFMGLLVLYSMNHKKSLYFLLVILIILLGGGSYVTGMFMSFLLFGVALYSFITKQKNWKVYLALMLVCGVAFSLNVFCPGNSIRMTYFQDVSIVQALFMTIPLSFQMLCQTLFNTLIVPILILFIPFFADIAKKTKYKFKFPFLLPFILLIMFILFFAPCTYAYGTFYQETRVQNIQFFYLTLFMFLSTFNLIGFLVQHKYKIICDDKNFKEHCAIVGIVALVAMTSAIGVDNFKSKIIADEIIFGVSPSYNQCMNNMFSELSDPNNTVVTLTNCSQYPRSLHHYILSPEGGWIIDDMETYFNKIIIIENEEDF